MKSAKYKMIRAGLAAVLLAAVSVSCNKVLDKKPENVLSSTQVYRNVFDADAAIVGLYGKFMGLAKQYVVLNELRADLLDVTINADADLRDLNEHSVKADNPYADPRPFYAVINDCNDILKNFNIMLADKKFSDIEYQQRYSDVGALRSWLYLQVGIHWGNVPYVTDPLETIASIRDASKFPVIPFSQLLDSLVTFTNSLPFARPYPGGTSINTGLITNYDGYNTKRFFIDKFTLLGDINLWKGNYRTAATYYRRLMEHEGYDLDAPNGLYSNGDQYYQEFRQPYADVVTNNDLTVGYIRFKESDQGSLIDNNSQGWRSMFARAQDNLWLQQWVWSLPFNSNFAPGNPFVNLFSSNGGSYLLKPSKAAIDAWNSQLQANGFPFDARGNFSVRNMNGQPVVMKYLYTYVDANLVPINPLKKDGVWFLDRAANIHLHFAEAANRDGKRRLAYALLNNGIGNTFDPTPGVSGRDVTNIMNTLYESAPYNFDARNGEVPRFRGDWYRNNGVRGDARVTESGVSGDSTLSIEKSLIDENGLELAFEGHRWGELVRIALRRNDPAFLADKVYNKLLKAGNPQAAAVRAKLMTVSNWYLPFKN
ncbi:MAG: RagB/SusD family protein [Bacteroidota bacterium]